MVMTGQEQDRSRTFRIDLWATIVAYAVALLMIVLATQLHAQTYTVLHNFAGSDGDSPQAGLTLDRAGNLYGTTRYGGSYNAGTVFKVTRQGSGWIFTPLYDFRGGSDGKSPDSRVVFGPDGSLYGTTTYGGGYQVGVVFKLQPSASACKTALCPWTETVLYSFTGQSDGGVPEGDLVFDQAGNIYGTTFAGGQGDCVPLYTGCGAVYELTPNGSGWTENVLHNFAAGSDGASPESGLTFDSSGDLYGVTAFGGSHTYGTAFELQAMNDGFSYSILYNFGLESETPVPTLTLDSAGNLYGTAQSGGTGNVGAVFELTPSGGSW